MESSSSQEGNSITNKQYAITFGGYDTDSATDVMGAFNLVSYHNLYDIKNFAKATFADFSDDSNPCSICHNPHMAKNHKDHPADPAYTTISLPTQPDELWGDDPDERMSNYTTYRAPYYYGSTTAYEPGNTFISDGANTTDYNTFCLSCHQYEVPVSTPGVASMNPNTTPGYLTAIDWSPATGDMHGERPRIQPIDGGAKAFGSVTAPYDIDPVSSNYVMSCLDCHDPHGSVLLPGGLTSNYLLRKEVNNNKVDGCGPGFEQYWCQIDFCTSCHTWSHCGGPQGCFGCHYHGGENIFCGPWNGPNF